VGGITGKAPLPLEGVVDAGEHFIKCPGQSAKFVVRQVQIEPSAQIARANPLGNIGDRGHRGQDAAGKEITTNRGEEEGKRTSKRQSMENIGKRLVNFVAVEADLKNTDCGGVSFFRSHRNGDHPDRLGSVVEHGAVG
jgi:hypothetical protein